MSEKKGAFDSILKSLFSFIFERIAKEIDAKIKSYISEIVKSMVRKIAVAMVGAILTLIGVVFICISFVRYLSIYVPDWAAWLIVGLAVLAVGSLVSMSMLRKEKRSETFRQ